MYGNSKYTNKETTYKANSLFMETCKKYKL